MAKIPEEKREDEVLLQKLQIKPKQQSTMQAKPNVSRGAPATKADHAALKRADKTVIKRMRKI